MRRQFSSSFFVHLQFFLYSARGKIDKRIQGKLPDLLSSENWIRRTLGSFRIVQTLAQAAKKKNAIHITAFLMKARWQQTGFTEQNKRIFWIKNNKILNYRNFTGSVFAGCALWIPSWIINWLSRNGVF